MPARSSMYFIIIIIIIIIIIKIVIINIITEKNTRLKKLLYKSELKSTEMKRLVHTSHMNCWILPLHMGQESWTR